MAKTFTKLYAGDIAYSSGGKCFKRLLGNEKITLQAKSTILPEGAGDYNHAIAIGANIYLFSATKVWLFDPKTNTFTQVATTSSYRVTEKAISAVGTKIYLFGGWLPDQGPSWNGTFNQSINTIKVFDTETNTIETLSTTLPNRLGLIASASVGTKIYLFGGYYSGTNAMDMNHSVRTIAVFDTETNTIETLSRVLPAALDSIATAVVGTKIYLFGGYHYSNEILSGTSIYCVNTINIFDTETNTIETLSTTLPTEMFSIASIAVGTKIYLFGGRSRSAVYSTINVFDTETNEIETLSTRLPKAMHSIATAMVGTQIYLFGGYSINNNGQDILIIVKESKR